jgi:lactoylglutathione lyase
MAKVSVNIDVDDIERATRFYIEAFGLTVTRRLGEDTVELGGAAVPIFLLEKKSGTRPFDGANTTRDYRRHWSPVHLDFWVRDIEAAVQRAESAGGVREGDIAHYAWGGIAYFADPFGNGFCLIEFKGRGYDEIAG